MNDLVSIILPVYNSEKTIKDTVESILRQTYFNFELLIINDGSDDNTDEICNLFSDKRIRYFFRKNHGVSNTRNFALNNSKGKYVVFIDSDDLYEKNYLSCLTDKIKEGYQLVTCGYSNFGKNRKKFIPKKEHFKNKLDYIAYLQSLFLFNQIWNKIYLKEIIDYNNIRFDENLSIAEDWNFNIDYLNKIEKFSIIDSNLYNYRISSTGLGFKYRNDANKIKLQIVDKMCDYFDCNCTSEFIANSYLKQYFSYFSNIVDKRNNLSKKEKKDGILNIINMDCYQVRLSKINKLLFKRNLLFILLDSRNVNLIYIVSKIANFYDSINKKFKFGL